VTASRNLRAIAGRVADAPPDALERFEEEARRIVDAAAPFRRMKGKKARGLPVTMARNQRPKLSPGLSSWRVQGTVPGWLWANSGTRAHSIPRRRTGKLRRLTIRHPGSGGRHAWRRVVADVKRAWPKSVGDEIGRAVR